MGFKIAVVGATGNVGREMLSISRPTLPVAPTTAILKPIGLLLLRSPRKT